MIGHHRGLAAMQAGLEEMPYWVEEMTDEEAYLELVRSNNQGELSLLEIGIHALEYVLLFSGGRGKSGSLSKYARAIGRSKGAISQVKGAASVYQKVLFLVPHWSPLKEHQSLDK